MDIINDNLLFIDESCNSLVMFDNHKILIDGSISKLIKDNALINGSTLEGRIKGSEKILNNKYKIPFVLSEKKRIILFPLKINGDNFWINFKQVKYYKKVDNLIEVTFKNNTVYKFLISYAIFNNQMLKSSRLWYVHFG